MTKRSVPVLALLLALAGCSGVGGDEDSAPATVTVTETPSDPLPSEMPQECADSDFAVDNPEMCGDAPLPAPLEVPVWETAEWSDGLTAKLSTISPRPYPNDPGGDLMLSLRWELTNTGDAEIPLGEGDAFADQAPFGDVLYYGENRKEGTGYLPNEGDSCASDLPQRLVPGSSVECLSDHLIRGAESGDIRVEAWHNGELIILTRVEELLVG